MTCRNASGPHIRCEAKYVWPEIPEWATTYRQSRREYGQGYGEGFGMTMEVNGDWTLVEMSVAGQSLRVKARKRDGKVEFMRVVQ